VSLNSAPLQSDDLSGYRGAVGDAFLFGIPAALLAALGQGLVALFFDVGLLYPVIGYLIGSVIRKRSSRFKGSQVLAVVLTYFAVALSPIIPYGREVGFDPTRMRNTSVGLVLGFVPLMAKTGLVGALNLGLLLIGLRQAWVQSRCQRIINNQSA